MVKINRPNPPLSGLMGQLMLAGCYDNVSRIMIYSTTTLHSTPLHHQLLINKNAGLPVWLEKGWARQGENIK